MTCFHMVIQGTQKVVVIGYHNFKDEALIKRWQAGQKMNGTGGKFKDKNKRNNRRKLFSFVVESCVFSKFWNSQKHECGKHDREMIKNSKGEGSTKEWTQTKIKGGSRTAEEKKRKKSWEEQSVLEC